MGITIGLDLRPRQVVFVAAMAIDRQTIPTASIFTEEYRQNRQGGLQILAGRLPHCHVLRSSSPRCKEVTRPMLILS
ncbi:hypothetical protein HYQ46_000703 [Verticillium longisporum]|nr:hypothetical protein HYQ44_008905 [Verticillium longisporum]KAG7150357.1 hypothetical protein HYQ46_000703 [Verticillium longisporum]